jgi:hypothetical protein
MTTEEIFVSLRDALAAQGYLVDNIRGPDADSWNPLYRNCLCNFLIEEVIEEEYVIRVINSWRAVVYPDGSVISCIPPNLVDIVRHWSAGFTQAG